MSATIKLSNWCFWRLDNGDVLLRSLEFVPLSIVNGLRRVLLVDLPALGFMASDMEVITNTTQFNSEYLCERLASIPLVCQRPDEWNPKVAPKLELNVKLDPEEAGPRMIVSNVLVEAARAVDLEIANRDIDLVELIRGVGITHDPQLHVIMHARVATGRMHSLFQVLTVDHFRHLTRWELAATNNDPTQRIQLEQRQQIMQMLNESLALRERYISPERDIERDELMGYPRYVEMQIGGSVGSMEPLIGVWHGFRILADLLENFLSEVESRRDDGPIQWVSDESILGLQTLIVQNADDTLGNCVKQAFLDELKYEIDQQFPKDDVERRNMVWRESLAHYSCLFPAKFELTIKLKASSQLGISTDECMIRGLTKYISQINLAATELQTNLPVVTD